MNCTKCNIDAVVGGPPAVGGPPVVGGPQITILKYADLSMDPSTTGIVFRKLAETFQPGRLPMLAIAGIPKFLQLQEDVLGQCYKLAHLDKDYLDNELSDPESGRQAGWSKGSSNSIKKTSDLNKGYFYYNALTDNPGTEDQSTQYPSIYPKNKWPSNELMPDFKEPAKELGTIMHNALIMLSKHLEHYMVIKLGPDKTPSIDLYKSLAGTKKQKCKLLYYYPQVHDAAVEDSQYWNGWHLDTGCITAHCREMYLHDVTGEESKVLDENAGLYIAGDTLEISTQKVMIPSNCMGVQFGDCLHILSGGAIKSTPHCVRSSNIKGQSRVAFVCFADTPPEIVIKAPENMSRDEVLKTEIEFPNHYPGLGELYPEIPKTYGEIHIRDSM